jgi:ubiquinone/menaquinone biosynthesis C-methylase UbiE
MTTSCRNRCGLAVVAVAAWIAVGLAPALRAQPSQRDTASAVPPPRKEYLGRQIAQTMHYTGAEWLIRDTREREERASLLLTNLNIHPGMTVCDMGCGNGFYSLPLAKLVGPTGRVMAVDIQPEMLVMLRARAEREGVENITPVLGSLHNPRLPAASADLILLVDVYHEFSHPTHMLAAMRAALKPNGWLALVEFRAEDPDVPIQPLHKMSKEQILKELPANGFRLAKEIDKLPWQHLMFFARDEQWQPQPDE